jgi:hypothetical protein
MRQRAFEIIGFVHEIIKQLDLPCNITEGGGISILSWSLGLIYATAVINLFNDPHLSDELKKTVKECISSVILFGQ